MQGEQGTWGNQRVCLLLCQIFTDFKNSFTSNH